LKEASTPAEISSKWMVGETGTPTCDKWLSPFPKLELENNMTISKTKVNIVF